MLALQEKDIIQARISYNTQREIKSNNSVSLPPLIKVKMEHSQADNYSNYPHPNQSYKSNHGSTNQNYNYSSNYNDSYSNSNPTSNVSESYSDSQDESYDEDIDRVNDPTTPWHSRYQATKNTCVELERFFLQRAQIEEEFGHKLLQLARLPLGESESWSLGASLHAAKQEIETTAAGHLQLAARLRAELQQPTIQATQNHRSIKRKLNRPLPSKLRVRSNCLYALERSKERLREGYHGADVEARFSQVKFDEADRNYWAASQQACDGYRNLEITRVSFFRKILWQYTNVLSSTCVADAESLEKVRMVLEKCDAKADVESLTNTYIGKTNVSAPDSNKSRHTIESSRFEDRPGSYPGHLSQPDRSSPLRNEVNKNEDHRNQIQGGPNNNIQGQNQSMVKHPNPGPAKVINSDYVSASIARSPILAAKRSSVQNRTAGRNQNSNAPTGNYSLPASPAVNLPTSHHQQDHGGMSHGPTPMFNRTPSSKSRGSNSRPDSPSNDNYPIQNSSQPQFQRTYSGGNRQNMNQRPPSSQGNPNYQSSAPVSQQNSPYVVGGTPNGSVYRNHNINPNSNPAYVESPIRQGSPASFQQRDPREQRVESPAPSTNSNYNQHTNHSGPTVRPTTPGSANNPSTTGSLTISTAINTPVRPDASRPILFYVKAIYDYEAEIPEEISLVEGQVVAVLATQLDGWWEGEIQPRSDDPNQTVRRGIFPSNFTEPVEVST